MLARALALLVVLTASPAVLAEAQDPCKRVAEFDRNAQPFDDQTYQSRITYREGGRVTKTFELEVTTKGLHKMLVHFTAPGEVRGMRILMLENGVMYTYLPEFRRVRRIAANARNQGYMGTNISYEDIQEQRFSDTWQCVGSKTTAKAWILDLVPNADYSSSYTKLRVTIDQKVKQVERIEYFRGEKHVQTQQRSNWKTIEGLTQAAKIVYTSHERDAETHVELTGWKVNQGIPESAFSRRALLRGE